MQPELRPSGAEPGVLRPSGAEPPVLRPVPIEKLRPAEYNPRRLDRPGLEALRRSLAADPKFLEVRPLIVNTYPGREMIVVGGNMRLRAARELGWTQVPCVMVSVDPATERRWNIRDNASAGEWVEEALAEMLQADADAGADIFDYGLSDTFIENLLGTAMPRPEADAARAQEAPPVPENPVCQSGDIWHLGNHTLLVGDFAGEGGAAVAETLLAAGKTEDGQRVSAFFLDPPYGIDFRSNMRVKTPKFRKIEGDTSVLDFGPAILAIAATDAAIYLCCGHQTLPRFRELYDARFRYKNTIIWDKGNHSMGDLQGAYASRYEMVLFYHRGRPVLREERPVDIWDYPRIPPKDHPTQKPVEMVEFALVHSTDPGDTVADLTVGSGTTLMAAEASGRVCLAGEVDPRYADVTVERFMLATRQDATRQDGASYAELKVRRGDG